MTYDLDTYRHLRGVLERAIADLRASQPGASLSFGGSEAEHQRAFSRVSRFFDGLRQAQRRAATPRFRSETEAMVATGDDRLLAWGLTFRANSGWEVDFLGIDYELRSHGARALASLERFANDYFDPFLARWADQEKLYHVVALRAG